MKTVAVLCGGKGTRLGAPVKCLAEVAGRPFLDWKLDQLEHHGADDIVLLVAHGKEAIRAHVGDRCRYIEDDGIGPWDAHAHAFFTEPHWLTYGVVLVDLPLEELDDPYSWITSNSPDEPFNRFGEWLDCGLYFMRYDSPTHFYRKTDVRTWQINTPDDLRRADAHLRRHGLSQ